MLITTVFPWMSGSRRRFAVLAAAHVVCTCRFIFVTGLFVLTIVAIVIWMHKIAMGPTIPTAVNARRPLFCLGGFEGGNFFLEGSDGVMELGRLGRIGRMGGRHSGDIFFTRSAGGD